MPRLPTAADFQGPAAPQPTRGVTAIDSRPFEMQGAGMQDLAQLVEQQTERIETLAAEDALNKLRERRLDLTMGKEKGFSNVVGAEAVVGRQLLKEYPQEFGKVVSELGGKLPTARARAKFTQLAQAQELGFKTDLARHVAKQTEVHEEQVYSDRIRVEAAYAADNYADPYAVEVSINRVSLATDKRADQMGLVRDGSKENMARMAVMHEEATGQVAMAALTRALANDDPKTARAIFEKYDDLFSVDQKNKITKELNAGDTWAVGKGVGENMISMASTGTSRTEVLAYARKNAGSREEMNAALSVFNQWDTARQQDRALAGEDVRRRLNAGESWFSIRKEPGVLDTLDPDGVAALDNAAAKAARGEDVKTDFVVWADVRREIENAAAAGRPPIDLTPLVSAISTSDLRALEEKQIALRGGENRVPDPRTFTQQIGTAQQEMRLGNSAGDKQRAAQFEKYVSDRVDQENRARAARGERPLDYAGREEIIREAKEIIVKGGFEAFGTTWFADETRRFETPAGEDVEMKPREEAPETGARAIPVPDERPREIEVPELEPVFQSDVPTPTMEPSGDIVVRPNKDAQGREIPLPPTDFTTYIRRKRPGLSAQEVYDLWAEYTRRQNQGTE